MGINPLQLPGPLVVPQVDWSGLNQIGDAIQRRNEREREAQAFSGLVDAIPTRGDAPAAGQPAMTPGQLPRGLRNNNPGNIEDGPLAKSLPGYKGSDGRFAIFDTPDNGMNAMDALLTSYGRRGHKTVRDVISRWAPANDGNNVENYARYAGNGDPDSAIDLSNAEQRRELAKRMARFENGITAGAPREGEAAPVARPSPDQMAAAQRGMPADMKRKVQALFAVGSPAATQVALGYIQKFIGNQEPLVLAEGGRAIDRDTGRVIAENPRAQVVREGGALVVNGKPVYESPGNNQFKVQEIELEDGTKLPVVVDAKTKEIRRLTDKEIGELRGNGNLPPEVNPKTVKIERSQALVKNEESAVNSGQAASNLLPSLNDAIDAYERAINLKAVGPNTASPPSRFVQARFLTKDEAARQDYEKAMAAIQAHRTAIQNKGLGAASDFERKMYAAQYPDLTAVNPENQIAILKQLKTDAEEAIAEGKKLMLGKQPGVRMDRPPVRPAPASGNPPPAVVAPALGEVREGYRYKGGDPSRPESWEKVK